MRRRRLWLRQLTPMTLLGLGAAVLAEVGTIGLLGTSGWFIAASAIAGATVASTFSYVAPSAFVRTFAVLRIAANYVQRLLLHRDALRRLRDIRLEFFSASAAASAASVPLRGGRLLDRAMVDADTESMRVIRAIQPIVVYVVLSVVGVAVVSVVSIPATFVLAGSCVVAAVLAFGDDRMRGARLSEEGIDRARADARTELVTAVEAWPELVSIGAIDRVVDQLGDGTARYARSRRSARAWNARGALQLGVILAVAFVAAVAVTTLVGSVPAPNVVLVALVTAGLMTMASQLPTAFRHDREARDATGRLDPAATEGAVANPPDIDVALTADGGVALADYLVPESVFAPQHHVSGTAPAGACLVVVGHSGSGKTTLLASMSTALEGASGGRRVVFVPTDDYLFTGTILENMRLADPEVTEETVRRVLTELRLDDFTDTTRIGVGGRNTSGGEETRLRIARGLLANPDVLLIDEPTAGLDDATARVVLTELRERMRHGVLIIAIHTADGLPRGFRNAEVLALDAPEPARA